MTPTDEAVPVSAPPASAANPAVTNATHALAIKELGEDVGKLARSVKTLWITVIVVAVLTVAVGITSFVPSLRMGLGGRPNFRDGQFNGTFQGTSGTSGTSTGQGTTGQGTTGN